MPRPLSLACAAALLLLAAVAVEGRRYRGQGLRGASMMRRSSGSSIASTKWGSRSRVLRERLWSGEKEEVTGMVETAYVAEDGTFKTTKKPRRFLADATLPPLDQVLKNDCSGWPTPRRFMEVQSWWTDEGANVTSRSKHVHLGACMPVGDITGPLTIDVVVRLHEQQGTNRYVSALYVNLADETVFSEWGLGLSCCSADCAQAYRLDLDLSKLDGNGRAILVIAGSIASPASEGLQDNEFASYELKTVYTVNIPGKAAGALTSWMDDGAQALSWGHRPWQYAIINLGNLPPATVKGVIPLPLWLGSGVRDDKKDKQSNLTGLLLCVDPVFHANGDDSKLSLGTVIMRFESFSWNDFGETAFLDTRTLSNGMHKLVFRVDTFIPNTSLPSSMRTGSPTQRMGGTNSAVLLLMINVQN